MGKKGITAFTLPVYDEVVKEVPEIVKKAMEEGKLPEGLELINIPNEDYSTDLSELLTQEQQDSLLSGKAILQFETEDGEMINYYPLLRDLDGYVKMIRFDSIIDNTDLICYNFLFNNLAFSCEDLYNDEYGVEIPLSQGTKLYKHNITLNDRSIGKINLKVISTYSEIVDDLTKLSNCISKIVSFGDNQCTISTHSGTSYHCISVSYDSFFMATFMTIDPVTTTSSFIFSDGGVNAVDSDIVSPL